MAQTAAMALRLQVAGTFRVPARKSILGSDVTPLYVPCAQRKTVSNAVVQVQASAPKSSDSTEKQARLASAVAMATLLATPGSATAIEASTVTSVLNQVEEVSKQVGDKAVVSYEFLKNLFEQVLDASKPVVEAATPVVQQAAQRAVEVATPVASDLAAKAKNALTDAGVDTTSLFDAARTAADVTGSVTQQTSRALVDASPVAQSTLESVLAQEPTILALGAGGLLLLYLLAPRIASSVAYSARGYAGELTAAQTLDLLTSADYTLVDVRTDKEKAKSGTPSLPRSAQKKRFNIPVEEVPSKLRGQLRNVRKVEAELTAIKIAALKRLGKGSKVAILDANGGIGKQVARALSSLGYRNTYVVKDGTDGGAGWVQSQLAMESYNYSNTEILSPSRVIPAAARVFGGTRSTNDVVDVSTSRRGFLLPGGADE